MKTRDEVLGGLRRARRDLDLARAIWAWRLCEARDLGLSLREIAHGAGVSHQLVHQTTRAAQPGEARRQLRRLGAAR